MSFGSEIYFKVKVKDHTAANPNPPSPACLMLAGEGYLIQLCISETF
jgi:hypothetical protein